MQDANLHAAQAQNSSQRSLSPKIHLQCPHKRDWQQSQNEVTNHRRDTVQVCNAFEVVEINASPRGREPVPKERDWVALQDQGEPKGKADDY